MFTPFFAEETLILALIAGLLAVDDRAGWQSLLAHPVFVAIPLSLILGYTDMALRIGVVLELVWLSILPMRGTRRPDTAVGAVVGIGTACMVTRYSGEPREMLMVGIGILLGLLVGEIAGAGARVLNRFRESRIGDFELPDTPTVGATEMRLLGYHVYSVGFHAISAAVMTAILFPLAVVLADRLAAASPDRMVVGVRAWVTLLPAIGAAALIQTFWHRDLYRFLVLSAAVVLGVLWIR